MTVDQSNWKLCPSCGNDGEYTMSATACPFCGATLVTYKTLTFQTSDGYTLHLIDGVWTDGDLSFDNVDGFPVDDTQIQLDGGFVR